MKNYIYILGLALSMSSCEDFLTRDNPTGITDAMSFGNQWPG